MKGKPGLMTTTETPGKPDYERQMARDIREVRNWARFIGILIMLSIIGAVIAGIVIAAHSHAVYCNNNPLSC